MTEQQVPMERGPLARDVASRVAVALDRLSEWLGRVAAWMLLVMTVLMLAVVVLRYGFNWGAIALQESVIYAHAIAFMLAMGYAFRHDAHVRVDILYARMSERGRAWVDLLGGLLLLLPVAVVLFWFSWDYVMSAWQIREGSRDAGGLPYLYLLKTLLLLMPLTLGLQGLASMLHQLGFLMTSHRRGSEAVVANAPESA